MPPVRYDARAEDYGGNGGVPEKDAHCYRCLEVTALHLEGSLFVCDLHCRCPNRGRVA